MWQTSSQLDGLGRTTNIRLPELKTNRGGGDSAEKTSNRIGSDSHTTPAAPQGVRGGGGYADADGVSKREAHGRSTEGYLDLDRRALGSDGGGVPKKVAAAVRSTRRPEITTRGDGAAARSVWCDRGGAFAFACLPRRVVS